MGFPASDIQQVNFDVLMFLIIGLSRFLTQKNALLFLYDTVICNLLLFVQIKNSWFLIPAGVMIPCVTGSTKCMVLSMGDKRALAFYQDWWNENM